MSKIRESQLPPPKGGGSMSNKIRISNLFILSVGSEDAYRFALLEAPSTLTQKEYDQLIDKLKKEAWAKLLSKPGQIGGDDLYEAVLVRLLSEEYMFHRVSFIGHCINEFK